MVAYLRSVGLTVPRVEAVNPLSVVGAGLNEAGQVLQQIDERQQVVAVSKELADTKLKWTQELIDRQQNAPAGAKNFEADVTRDFDADAVNRAAKFKGRARDYYETQVAQFRTNVLTDAKQFEIKEKNSDMIRTAQDTVDTHINAVRTDPRLFESANSQIDGLIAGLQLPASVVAKFRDESKQRLGQSVIQAKIDSNPDQALKDLTSGKFDSTISPAIKNTLVEQAQRASDRQLNRALAFEARQDRVAAKLLKQAGDDAEKDLWSKAEDHTLQRDDVDAAKRVLSPTSYKALLQVVNGKDQPDDAATYAGLLLRADNEDIQRDATVALQNKQLSLSSYTSLIAKNQAFLKEGNAPNPAKSGREYVKSALDPALFPPGPAAAMAGGARANAVIEYDNWIRKNPNATQPEIDSAARDIANRHATINLNDTDLARGAPAGLPYSKVDLMGTTGKDPQKMLDDLKARGAEIADKYPAGQVLTPDDQESLRIIDAWMQSIQKRMTLTPAKKK